MIGLSQDLLVTALQRPSRPALLHRTRNLVEHVGLAVRAAVALEERDPDTDWVAVLSELETAESELHRYTDLVVAEWARS